MLQALTIKNFALIESLEINFSNGLSVITGETGSGKSILLDALGLVLGARADLNSLKDKESKCVVEAVFKISDYQLEPLFLENDIDFEAETTIRREILPNGKSRAFVNDTPATLSVLSELAAFLIDVHSQHQTRSISETAFQFEVLDTLAKNQNDLQEYTQTLKQYKAHVFELTQLNEHKAESQKNKDYDSYLYEELVAAQLVVGEQEILEEELEKLNHTEVIKTSLAQVLSLSQEENIGIISQLKEVKSSLQKIATYSKEYNELFERVMAGLIEYEDVLFEIEKATEKVFDDPKQLEFINQKLQLIYNLQKKHQVGSVEDLCEIREAIALRLEQTHSLDERIAQVQDHINQDVELLQQLAEKIEVSRQKSIPVLEQKVLDILAKLGMPNARLQVQLQRASDWLPNGFNQIQFLFSANKGMELGTIKKVASGGEMSRIMLAIKAVLSEYAHLPTIIFDEIDTGVSGDIAGKMAEIMAQMSRNMQVFSITHLPQIAAKGKQHYKVFKSTTQENTVSGLKLLSTDERVLEIAEMLSGKQITDSALIHAKSLLN